MGIWLARVAPKHVEGIVKYVSLNLVKEAQHLH